ncbi:hypothetical protein DL991_10765 [Amycolatopsis sp. WAC 01375]|uniref:hypothetical protein n=1 Tax=Amycolatopsis sp. WAC 01375 TaxID=2203194 RepID=UPI000F78B4EF|nr:hypothetical protein [Amycolatopsis sp. WAC 01375]RSM80584.1 hypothetical protein DL991_10765 [Amycolatopsis sp. WAC 01375]
MVLTKSTISRRAKLGLVAAAAAAVSSLAGAGLASAEPGHIIQPQANPVSYLGGQVPDGTRITGLTLAPGHSWADGRGVAAEASAAIATEVPVKVTGGLTLARDQHGPGPSNYAQPPAMDGQMSVKAGYQWHPGRNGSASGVRIRASVPSGTVVGLLPRYAHLWISCERYAGGSWWSWIGYYTGSRWIYGFSSSQYVYPSPDRSLPRC